MLTKTALAGPSFAAAHIMSIFDKAKGLASDLITLEKDEVQKKKELEDKIAKALKEGTDVMEVIGDMESEGWGQNDFGLDLDEQGEDSSAPLQPQEQEGGESGWETHEGWEEQDAAAEQWQGMI